ncbi:hypothetical protein NUH88_01950 [Nisaea acidiphila]|uniref:Uncharacterized protein n=1 Tax=Nisaea acidiphila TaxID=1862145 RepID=A0A9J7AT46_9PROT|nr:hypothetical protein [Nisaea acidiphila]UUX50463.1 hypothetical protein NUH88_01950 [Nisaea acidiphila]
MIRKTALFLAFAIGTGMVSPADAADKKLQEAIAAYGAAAGRIEASVPFCGGPKEEAEFFVRQAKELAEKAGAGPVEWAAIRAAMEKAKAGASFTNYDCSENGGRELATELMAQQRALQAALN